MEKKVKNLRLYIRELLLQECWKTHKQVGMKKKGGKMVPNCVPKNEIDLHEEDHEESHHEGLDEADTPDKDRMKCNKPRYIRKGETGHGKKQKVVKACKKGKEKLVKFGDANMRNNSDKPKNRADFRKRHNCKDKKDNMKAGYWACKDW